jgi:hypothetical protein
MKTLKMNFKRSMFIAFAFGLLFFMTSCNEKNDVNDDLNSSTLSVTAEDELYTAEVFDEVIEITDEAIEIIDAEAANLKSATLGYSNGKGHIHHGNHFGPCDSVRGNAQNNRLGECVTVTREIFDEVKTVTIDFGEVNCLCNDGRERRGKIIMVHEGQYYDSLVFITVTFEDFYVDDNQILGEKTISKSINADGNRESAIIISGSMVFADGSGTITYESEKVRTIVEGSDTRTKRDDVTETTGSSSCVLADGTESSMTILSPLVRINEVGCMMYIVKGIREISVQGASSLTIDYGDGTCDNLATVTQDGVSTEIELKRKGGLHLGN